MDFKRLVTFEIDSLQSRAKFHTRRISRQVYTVFRNYRAGGDLFQSEVSLVRGDRPSRPLEGFTLFKTC